VPGVYLLAAWAVVAPVIVIERRRVVHLVFTVLAQTAAAPVAALIASVLYFRLVEIHRQRPAAPAPTDLPPRLS